MIVKEERVLFDKHYIPKGGMCMMCNNASEGCSKLPFHTMQPLTKYPDGTTAVRCTNYERQK